MRISKLLNIFIILILFPVYLFAQNTDISSVTPLDPSISSTTTFTVNFTTASALNSVSDEIVITFPAGFDASGAGINGPGTVTPSGTDPLINAGESNASVVVLDIQAAEAAGVFTIVLTGIINHAIPQNDAELDVSTRLDDNTVVDSDDATPAAFDITGTLTLEAADAPINSNSLVGLDAAGGTDIEITTFKLTAAGENFDIDTIRITPVYSGMTNTEITQVEIFRDLNNDGILDGGEPSVTQTAVDDPVSGNSIPLEINFTQNTGSTNFIVVATLAATVQSDDAFRINIDAAASMTASGGSITGSAPVKSGAGITGFSHIVTGELDITSVVLANTGINDTGRVTITFTSPTTLSNASDEIVITFPAGFDLSLVGVDGSTSLAGGAVPTLNGAKTSGQVVTLTTNGTVNAGSQTVVLSGVINPAAIQNNISVDVITQNTSDEKIDDDDASPATFDVTGVLYLDTATSPIITNSLKQLSNTLADTVVLTTFKLTAEGENAPVDSIVLIPYFGGMGGGIIDNINIFRDLNSDGILDAGEPEITAGAQDEAGSGNPVSFEIPAYTQAVGSTDFLVTADLTAAIQADDSIRIDIDSTGVWTLGIGATTGSTVSGNKKSITGHTHLVSDTLNVTKISLSNPGVSSTSSDTLVFTTLTHLKTGDEILITYPAGFTSTGATVNAAGTVTPSTTDPVKNAGESVGQNVVLTLQDYENPGPFTIVLSNVVNPVDVRDDISLTVSTRTGVNDLIDAVDTSPDTFDVVATLTLAAAAVPIDTNILKQKHLLGSEDSVVTTFRLTGAGENVPVESINLTPLFSGMAGSEISSINIYSDDGDGKVNGADAPVTSGPVNNPVSGTPITFSTPGLVQNVGSSDFIVVSTFAGTITASDWYRINVNQASDIEVSQGATAAHAERIGNAIGGWTHTVSDSLNLTGFGMSNPGVSRTGTDTIKVTSMAILRTNDRIIVEYPAGFDASGAALDGGSTVPSGSLAFVSATATTVTVRAAANINPGSIKLILGGITNPAVVKDETTVTVHTETAAADLIDRADTTPATFDVVATLTLQAATTVIDTNVLKLKHQLGITNAIFTTFKLTAAGEDVPITQLSVTPVFGLLGSAELSNIGIYLDNAAGNAKNGKIDGGEALLPGTALKDDGGSGVSITYTPTFTQAVGDSDFIVIASLAPTVTVNDSLKFNIDAASVYQVGVGPVTGSPAELVGSVITGFQHIVTDSANVDNITNSNTGVSQTSSFTILFNTTTNIGIGDEVVVEFPAGFDASGFTVNASITTPSGSDPTKNAGETNATTAVLDMAAFEPAGSFTIVLDNIVNPSDVRDDITLNVYTRTDANDLVDEVDSSLPTFDIGATLTVNPADNPITANQLKQVESYGVTKRELSTLKLSVSGENVPVNSIQITPVFSGMSPAEISNLDIYLDNGAGGGTANDGILDPGESSIAVAPVDDSGSGTPVTLNTTGFTQSVGDTNLIVVADLVNSVGANDSLRINITDASVIGVGNGPVTGIAAEALGSGITGFKHYVSDTSRVTDVSLQYSGIGQTSRYDITFTTKTNLVSGNEEIIMVFPAAIDPQTATINGGNTVTQSGTDPVIAGSSAGDTLVFSIQARENAGSHVISLDNIVNPAAVQNDVEIKVFTRTAAGELIDAPAGTDAVFDIVGTMILAAADAPVDTNRLQQAESYGVTTRELTTFKLTAAGEIISISNIQVTPAFSGMTAGEITGITVYRDNGSGGGIAGNGLIDGAEPEIATAPVPAGASGTPVTITLLPYNMPAGTENFIVAADLSSSVSANDQLKIDVNAAADFTLGGGGTTGSPGQKFGALITGINHTVTDSVYVTGVTASPSEINAVSQYTVSLTTSTDLASGDSLLLTFPGVIDISGAALNAGTTTPSGTDPSLSSITGQVIHLRMNAAEADGVFSLIFDGIVNSGAVQNDLTISAYSKSSTDHAVDRAENSPATFDIVGSVTLVAAAAPVDSNTLAYTDGIGGTTKVMTTFRLTAAGESYKIDQLSVTPVFTGMTSTEVFDIDVYLDDNIASNGKVEVTESSIATAAVNDAGSGNPVNIILNNHTLPIGSQDYILVASFTGAVTSNDDIRFDINDSTTIVSSSGGITGATAFTHGDSIRGFTHIVTENVNIQDVSLQKSGFNETGTVTIQYTSSTDLDNTGDEIVITFPTGFDLTNAGLDASTVTSSGTDPTYNAGESSGLVVVLDIQAQENAGAQNIVLSGIKNPNTLQDEISLNVQTRLDNNNPVDGPDATPVTFDITGTIVVDDGDSVISVNNLGSLAEIGGTDIPLITFKLTVLQEDFALDSIKIRPVFTRIDPAELFDFNIYLDDGSGGGTAANAEIDGTEATITTGAKDENGSGSLIKFVSNGHNLPVGTYNYIISASFLSTVDPDDSIRIDIDSTMVFASGGSVTGGNAYVRGDSVRGLTHIVDTRFNVNHIILDNPGFGDITDVRIRLRTIIPLPAPDDEIVITFPDTMDISNISLSSETMTPSGVAPSIDIAKSSGQTIVLNVNSAESAGIYDLVFHNVGNPEKVVKDLTCIIITRKDDGTVLADKDETPAKFSVTGKVGLSKGANPITRNSLEPIAKTGGHSIPMTSFRLNMSGENAAIDTIWILPIYEYMNPSYVYNFNLFLDDGAGDNGIAGNGKIEGEEQSIAVSAVDDLGSGNPVPIVLSNHSLQLDETQNYIITASFSSNFDPGDNIRVDIDSSRYSIIGTGNTTLAKIAGTGGKITGSTHVIPGLKLPDINDTTITEGQKLVLDLKGPFTELPGRKFSIDNLPNGAVFDVDNGLFSWTPDLSQATTYPYTFAVYVPGESDSKSINITVLDIDPLKDLVHADSTVFRSGYVDSVTAKPTGIYVRHKTWPEPYSVATDRRVIVRQPEISKVPLEDIISHPSTVEFVVEDYENGFNFSDSVYIQVEYKDFEIANSEENMRIFTWDTERTIWKQVPGIQTVDLEDNTITVKVDHFTIYRAQEVVDSLLTVTLNRGWNMLGIPIEPSSPATPGIHLSDDILNFKHEPGNSSIYKYNSELSQWQVPENLFRGTGYIIWTYETHTVIDIGGVEALSDVTHSISDEDGWALVGNPFLRTIDWTSNISKTNIVDEFYQWDGKQYLFYPDGGLNSSIQPWQAFFVRSNADNALITFEYPGPEAPGKSGVKPPQYIWRARILADGYKVTTGDSTALADAIDHYNYFGASEEENTAGDLNRIELSPISDNYISLYFKDSDEYLTQLILEDSTARLEWEIEVKTNLKNGIINLKWELPELYPKERDLIIHDNYLETDVNMLETSAYEILSENYPDSIRSNVDNTTVYSFKIVSSMKNDEEPDEAGLIPDRFYLEQNYPNPFNSNTTIEYGLPEESHITVKIYNILGQHIKTLVNEEKPAGRYNVRWDGTNTSNIPVSSGMYIYVIKSPNFTKTKKLIMIK